MPRFGRASQQKGGEPGAGNNQFISGEQVQRACGKKQRKRLGPGDYDVKQRQLD